MSYMIRKAEKEDLPRIYEIYETARQFMRENGNQAQWGAGDRPEELLEDDISQGNLYVLEDAVADEAIIHAVFAFIEGEDPVYLKIEQGSWMVDTEYAAVHRVASDGTVRNVLEKKADFDFDDYGYTEHELEERTKEEPSNTNNTSELEKNNGETMMYMVNKLNQNKEEEK